MSQDTDCCPLGREMAEKLNEIIKPPPKKRGPAKKEDSPPITFIVETKEEATPMIITADGSKTFPKKKRTLTQSQSTDNDVTEIPPPKKGRKRSLSKSQATDQIKPTNPFVEKPVVLETSSSNEDDLKIQVMNLKESLSQLQSVVSNLPIDDILARLDALEKKGLRGMPGLTFHSYK